MFASLTFLFLIAAILWFVIGSKGSKILKAFFIFASIYLCASLGFSLQTFKGWPSNSFPAGEFQLHWAIVEEPNKKTGDPGSIYMWVSKTNEEERKGIIRFFINFGMGETNEPRAFKISYSRDLHTQIAEAQKRIMLGRRVMVKSKKPMLPFEVYPTDRSDNNSNDFEFYDLPPPKPPRKNYDQDE